MPPNKHAHSWTLKVFVDFHRAQRGLIGKGAQSGNHLMYQEFASKYPSCDIPFTECRSNAANG